MFLYVDTSQMKEFTPGLRVTLLLILQQLGTEKFPDTQNDSHKWEMAEIISQTESYLHPFKMYNKQALPSKYTIY